VDVAAKPARRVRDPERRERILNVAAELIARNGYFAVSLDEIGSAAGIVGSGIYRHFGTKVAILVEMFDRVVDRLVSNAEELLRTASQPEAALVSLVRGHVEFTLSERALCEVYLQELKNLPANDRRRLRWKQRHYVDLWLDLLQTARADLTPGQAQVRVHAAISTVHSVLQYHSQLSETVLAEELVVTASDALGISAPTAPTAPTAAASASPEEASGA
jgi:AcrR family transcriptional regulator